MRLYPCNERAGRRVEAEGKQTAASGTSRQEIQLIRVKRIRAAGETAFCLSLFVENSRHVIRTDWFDRWFQWDSSFAGWSVACLPAWMKSCCYLDKQLRYCDKRICALKRNRKKNSERAADSQTLLMGSFTQQTDGRTRTDGAGFISLWISFLSSMGNYFSSAAYFQSTRPSLGLLTQISSTQMIQDALTVIQKE